MRSLVEIAVTPNRGDAMSVLGIARELAAAGGAALRPTPAPTVPAAEALDNTIAFRSGSCPARAARASRTA